MSERDDTEPTDVRGDVPLLGLRQYVQLVDPRLGGTRLLACDSM